MRLLKKSRIDFLKGGDESFKWGSVRTGLRPRCIMGIEFKELFGVMKSWGEAILELPSDLRLLPASSLDSQSFAMVPPTDEVARNLHTLISKCLHGKNYCRQVLCLYELAKVCARGGCPKEHSLKGRWDVRECTTPVESVQKGRARYLTSMGSWLLSINNGLNMSSF